MSTRAWNFTEWDLYVQKLVAQGTNARIANDYFGRRNFNPADYGRGSAFAAHNLYMGIGACEHDYDEDGVDALSNAGAVWIFERADYEQATQYEFKQKVTGFGTNGRAAGDLFGAALDIYLDRMVVAAPGQDYDEDGDNFLGSAGAAYVFQRHSITGAWTGIQKLAGSGFGTNDRIAGMYHGGSVAMSEEWLFVGAEEHEYDRNGENYFQSGGHGPGVIFVYKWNQSLNQYEAHSRISLPAVYRNANCLYFGLNCAAWYPHMISSAWIHGLDENLDPLSTCGAAYVFKYNTGADEWGFLQRLIPYFSDHETVDYEAVQRFGSDCDILDELIVVGHLQNNHDEDGGFSAATTGAAHIYELNATSGLYEHTKKLVKFGAYSELNFDWMGDGVCCMHRDLVAVGVPHHGYDQDGDDFVYRSGAVYVYEKVNGIWTDKLKLAAADTANFRNASDYFGKQVQSDRAGGLYAASTQQYFDENGENSIQYAGAIYLLGGQDPIVDYQVYHFNPDANLLGKLKSVQGVISREVNFATGEIPANSITMVFDNTDDHFWREDIEQNIVNTPVSLKLYMDGVTGSGLLIHKGRIVDYTFGEGEFQCVVADVGAEIRNKIIPTRAVSPSTGFTQAGQHVIDRLSQDSRPVMIPYGSLYDEEGACPTVLYDTESYRYLCAGCTISLIDQVYVDGVSQTSGFTTNLGSVGPDGEIVAFIEFAADKGQSVVTWNGEGKLDYKDELMENGVDIMVDVLQTLAGLTSGDFDLGSLTGAKDKVTGLKYAGVVGSQTFERVGEVIANLSLSMNARSFFNYDDRFSCRVVDGSTQDTVLPLNVHYDFTQEPRIRRATEEFISGVRVMTRQVIQYKRRYQEGQYKGYKEISSEVFRKQYGFRSHSSGVLQSSWIRDDDTADWLIQTRFVRFRKPLYYLSGNLFFEALEGEIGDTAEITRASVPADSGRYDWNGKAFEIVRVSVDPNNIGVQMAFLEI